MTASPRAASHWVLAWVPPSEATDRLSQARWSENTPSEPSVVLRTPQSSAAIP